MTKAQTVLDRLRHSPPSRAGCKTCLLSADQLKVINEVKASWKAGELQHLSSDAIHRCLVEEINYPYSRPSLTRHFEHE